MLIYDVLNKERVYQVVIDHLRNLGVKRRFKKQIPVKPDKHEDTGQSFKKVFKTHLAHLPLDVVKLSSGAIVHVPQLVSQACAYIEKHITHEGLFRKAGSHLRQKEIISRLDAGGVLSDKYQVIDVANILKTFFRDLPEPLIPRSYHDVFLRCALLKSSRVEALLMACILLPPHNLNTLAFFAEFLKHVAKYEKHNKMGIDNLAKVVGPNLMPLQETTMSALQSRLETHLFIIKIFIENAELIGVLPDHVSDLVAAEATGSVENELDTSDSMLRSKHKKKKRRSGSLTRKPHLSASNLNLRMLNGLKKMVSKSGSPDEVAAVPSTVIASDFNPAHTPSIKTGKKRKVTEPMAPLSAKKKREVIETMPDGVYPRHGNVFASIISKEPNPCKDKSPVQKSRVRKYLSQKVHNEITGGEKLEQKKKIRLSLDRLVSKSKQKVPYSDMDNHKVPGSPKIERRWSSVSGASWSKKKRETFDAILAMQSQLKTNKEQGDGLQQDYEQDEVFMDADVNLSDDNAIEERGSSQLMNVDRQESQPRSDGDVKDPKIDDVFTSNFSHCYQTELDSYKSTYNFDSQIDGRLKDVIDPAEEEYVTIPKSEYEEIKSRVFAIESRISQEFGCISTNSSQNLTQSFASKVQSEYEKTLEEASIGSTATADNLAKRLGKELKIRRSAEHKIIRSPSARKIGNLRRRSQEKPTSKRASRHVSWVLSKKTGTEQPVEELNNLCPKSNLKRGRPNTVYTGLMQPNSQNLSISDTICSEETNARLNFLQKQLHTLITHTVEHTKGSLSDDDFSITEHDAMDTSKGTLSSAVQRASSFHGLEFIDNSRHFNKKIRELKKSNSQQDVTLNSECFSGRQTGGEIPSEKNVTWKDADCYFSSDRRTNTPAPQTGRASIAKLRTQNAGMVLAKAKLFGDTSKKEACCNRRYSVKLSRSREVKSSDLDSTIVVKKVSGTPRRKHSKSPKNNSSKLMAASSPMIKMELTIMPSQQNVQRPPENRLDRHNSQKCDRQRLALLKNDVNTRKNYRRSLELTDNNYLQQKENKNVLLSSMQICQSPDFMHKESNRNILDGDSGTPCKTPHIKRPLTLKTPKDARTLIRKHGTDSRRTPMKAVALTSTQLSTPRRQSPKSALKSRPLTRSVS